jgi:hypothetical protein
MSVSKSLTSGDEHLLQQEQVDVDETAEHHNPLP